MPVARQAGRASTDLFEEGFMKGYSSYLHVANGSCTARVIVAAGIAGPVSIWADPLHEGPVPAHLTDEELLRVRARYLAEPTERSYAETVNELRGWRTILENHSAYREIVLWFEHDLFDQLNLIQMLSWIRKRLPVSTVVSLVSLGSFAERPGFTGLGELTPDELAPLLDARDRVEEEQYVLAERAWQAFREPTPESLEHLGDSDTAALPNLAAAITRFLQEYPWTRDGLSRSERRLLRLAETESIELSTALARMHEGEDAYYITDASLSALVDALSENLCPLLMRASERPSDGRFLHGSVALTDTGRTVLSGRQDKIAVCGIDRWLGGVHLRTDGILWRWDDTRHQITRC
jgi:hypothetical protein